MYRLVATLALCAVPLAAAAATPPVDCHVGLYRFADGGSVDIGTSSDDTLRWRRPDGTSGAFAIAGAQAGVSRLGWTSRPDGRHVTLADCARDEIAFDGMPARRVALRTTETRFTSDGTTLAGRLVMPPGDAPVPVVVLLQGAEHDSARLFDSMQRRFPGEGIGAFVFDKRGTGESGGRYTQDFDQLARDAVAALAEARRLGGTRVARIGYMGPSQGGWVAPIAANAAPVDFVIVSFGLAVSVLEEDRSSVAMDIDAKGWPAPVMARAMALVDAADAVALHPSMATFDRFAAIRDKDRAEPWFKDVHGDFAFAILPLERDQLAGLAEKFDFHTPFLYDPLATIDRVAAPQLWIQGRDDLEAPYAETARRLAQLRLAGRPVATALYPHAEHGIYEYETAADGTRTSLRQPDGYLALMADFARGATPRAAYGDAQVDWPQR